MSPQRRNSKESPADAGPWPCRLPKGCLFGADGSNEELTNLTQEDLPGKEGKWKQLENWRQCTGFQDFRLMKLGTQAYRVVRRLNLLYVTTQLTFTLY